MIGNRAWTLVLTAVLGACSGGGSDPAPPAANVAATWIGTWASANGSGGGSITLTLTQDGGTVAGSVEFTGSPCFAGGAVSGSVSGQDFTGQITAGGIRVTFATTISGASLGRMNGTYDTVSAGACTGDVGTVTLARVAPSMAEPPPPPAVLLVDFVFDAHGLMSLTQVHVRRESEPAPPATTDRSFDEND